MGIKKRRHLFVAGKLQRMVDQLIDDLRKIQLKTHPIRQSFARRKLDRVIVWPNNHRLAQAQRFRDIMLTLRTKAAADNCQITKLKIEIHLAQTVPQNNIKPIDINFCNISFGIASF